MAIDYLSPFVVHIHCTYIVCARKMVPMERDYSTQPEGTIMSKEIQYTIRVEPALKDEFLQAANRHHTKGAQVLREFMRGYVASATPEAANQISEDEQRARQKAVGFATASVGLEGFKLSDSDQELAARYVSGELDIDAFIATAIEQSAGH